MDRPGKKNPPLNSLRAFEATARHLNLVKAAKELRVTHSAISQQIKLLENYLEIKLLERSKNRISLTENGRKYAKELNTAFNIIHTATEQLLSTNDNVITINMLTTFAMRWLIPRLSLFQEQYPHLEVRISTPAKEVDFEHESIDLAIYYGKGVWPDLHVNFLFEEYLIPVCSPKLAQKFKKMKLRQIISNSRLLYVKTEERKDAWSIWFNSMGFSRLVSSNDVHLQNSMQAIEAAISGLGIAIAPEIFVHEDIVSGRLVQLTDKKVKSPNNFYLVFPKNHENRRKVLNFKEWLLNQIKLTA